MSGAPFTRTAYTVQGGVARPASSISPGSVPLAIIPAHSPDD